MIDCKKRVHPTSDIHTVPREVEISKSIKQYNERTYYNDFENHNCPLIREQNPSDGVALYFVTKSRGEVERASEVEKR